ncbi:hypothetical protein M413DRAFT_146551 [Hebeloma cylindrosporum]|uniref:Uncharacterized protein n=1 Tax=Hebeloma cylindrosporum TaxID=76867 RepID=A0A0C2XUJ6_HEBCY|nr:hypothetical protein M413DRAFT_146551 [Hebeloma cylindrosporum h7]
MFLKFDIRLVGNGILRAAHLAHYTNNASAAAIGATGAIIASLIMGIFLQCMPKDENGEPPWFITLFVNVLACTLTGTIGCAILIHNHVDLGPIDVLHATRAGALGGAILGPGMIVILPLFFAAVMIVLSPLWLAMMMGLRWVSVRSSESWDGRTHKFSYCYTYGTCGDDPEIEEELAQLPRSRMYF